MRRQAQLKFAPDRGKHQPIGFGFFLFFFTQVSDAFVMEVGLLRASFMSSAFEKLSNELLTSMVEAHLHLTEKQFPSPGMTNTIDQALNSNYTPHPQPFPTKRLLVKPKF